MWGRMCWPGEGCTGVKRVEIRRETSESGRVRDETKVSLGSCRVYTRTALDRIMGYEEVRYSLS